jgi:hypothetical protein
METNRRKEKPEGKQEEGNKNTINYEYAPDKLF